MDAFYDKQQELYEIQKRTKKHIPRKQRGDTEHFNLPLREQNHEQQPTTSSSSSSSSLERQASISRPTSNPFVTPDDDNNSGVYLDPKTSLEYPSPTYEDNLDVELAQAQQTMRAAVRGDPRLDTDLSLPPFPPLEQDKQRRRSSLNRRTGPESDTRRSGAHRSSSEPKATPLPAMSASDVPSPVLPTSRSGSEAGMQSEGGSSQGCSTALPLPPPPVDYSFPPATPGDFVALENDPALPLVRTAIIAASHRKAEDIVAMRVRYVRPHDSPFWLIMHGHSYAQLHAICETIERALLRRHGVPLTCRAGIWDSGWLVMEFEFLTVSVMTPFTRAKYAIEARLPKAERVDVSRVLSQHHFKTARRKNRQSALSPYAPPRLNAKRQTESASAQPSFADPQNPTLPLAHSAHQTGSSNLHTLLQHDSLSDCRSTSAMADSSTRNSKNLSLSSESDVDTDTDGGGWTDIDDIIDSDAEKEEEEESLNSPTCSSRFGHVASSAAKNIEETGIWDLPPGEDQPELPKATPSSAGWLEKEYNSVWDLQRDADLDEPLRDLERRQRRGGVYQTKWDDLSWFRTGSALREDCMTADAANRKQRLLGLEAEELRRACWAGKEQTDRLPQPLADALRTAKAELDDTNVQTQSNSQAQSEDSNLFWKNERKEEKEERKLAGLPEDSCDTPQASQAAVQTRLWDSNGTPLDSRPKNAKGRRRNGKEPGREHADLSTRKHEEQAGERNKSSTTGLDIDASDPFWT